MNIVYLLATGSGSWGGMERHVFDLAGQMAQRGHVVHVVAAPAYRPHCPAGVDLIDFDWGRHRWNPLLAWDLRRRLRRLAPHIVHAHGGKAAAVLARAGWPAGAVAVGSVHGTKSQHRAYRRLHAVVAVSRQIAAGIRHPRIRVIHNGIAPRAAEAEGVRQVREWMRDKPHPLVLAVGRLAPVKGFDVLLEAWPAQAHATLALLGDGPERDCLQAIVQRRGLGNVHLLGHRHDVREWLACADLMVIASRREGFPYVLVEALQAGVPVVSTAVSGANEMLAAEWLVPPDTVADLQTLLERVLPRSKAELAGLQGELIARAQAELTLAGMTTAMEALYRELLGETAREKEDR